MKSRDNWHHHWS